MKKFTLYMGLNDQDTKTQEIATVEAFKITNKILLQYVEGATVFEADGIYKHEDGTFTTEKTLRIELLFVEVETVKTIVSTLKTVFNQESIAVNVTEVKAQFI